MKQEALNRDIINEIQMYLANLGWSENREYFAERLNAFLKGVQYALDESELTFRLRKECSNYNTIFRVDVTSAMIDGYSGLPDYQSDDMFLFSIYENKIDYSVEKFREAGNERV